MSDLTVENMFCEKWFSRVELVPGMALGTPDRKKILEHVIARVTSDVLNIPGSNPIGFSLTVTPEMVGDEVSLRVTATAPAYELSDTFFV